MTLPFWPPATDRKEIPDGTTWTGTIDGRGWETAGDDLLIYGLSLSTSPRETLAAAWLTAIGDIGVQVYPEPPEVPAPPCVVIRPADPYQAPYHAGGTAGSAWAFEVDILMRRHNTASALRSLELAREFLTATLPAGWRWLEFGDIGETVIAKKAYLKGTLGVAVALVEGIET